MKIRREDKKLTESKNDTEIIPSYNVLGKVIFNLI